MLAIEIARRIEEKMGREVDVANLIKHTTIESLAEAIRASDDVARQSPIVKLSSGDGLPMFLIHPVGGEVFSYRDLVSGLRGRFNVHGIRQVTALSEPDVSLHAEEYIEAIKEVQPEGPYLVSGWSYGGIVAAEIARLLALAGDGVHNLILLDTTPSTPPEREKALTMSEHEWLLGFEYDRSRQLGVYGPVGEARGFARLKATTSRGMRLELAERMKRNGLLPASASEEQWLHYLEIYRNNYLAQANWMPDFDGLDVPTVLVHARDSSSEEAAHLLWSAFGLEIDEVVSVPGTHGDFLEGERGAALGARLEPFFAVDAPAPHG
jgi:thioesterase domain-containing protein